MRRRETLPTSNHTSLVDTFTCAIATLFVLILSLQGISTQPFGVLTPEVVIACSLADQTSQPQFRFLADTPAIVLSASQMQRRLEALTIADALSKRIMVTHPPTDEGCRELAQRIIDAVNEASAAQIGGTSLNRPYVIVDFVSMAEAEHPPALAQ